MFLYSPPAFSDSSRLSRQPLVVVLHGCNQNAHTIAEQSGWNRLADQHRFFVLYAQQKWWNNPSKCFNWFRNDDIERGNGEVASLHQMVRYTIQNYPIDTSNIFVYGLSAGAAMGVSLMANYPSKFRAGAIFAGGPYKVATNALEAMQVMVNPPDKTPEEWGTFVDQQLNAGHRYISSTQEYEQVDIEDLQQQIDRYHPLE